MAGEVDIDAMLRRITAQQFREWLAYYEMEPFGQVPENFRAASICQTIANVNRGKNQRAFKLEEFLLKFGDPEVEKPREQTVQEKLNVMTVIMRAMAEVQAEKDAKLDALAVAATAEAHGVTVH